MWLHFVLSIEGAIMNMEELELRYIAIKLSELNETQKAMVNDLLNAGVCPITGVVIEKDWPEYGPTVEALKTRITKESLPPLPEGAMPWDDDAKP
jgi:hypothetical protein